MPPSAIANESAVGAQTDARAGKYLTFQLANEEFGIRVLKVREIMGLQEIPPFRRRRSISRASSTCAVRSCRSSI